MDRKRPAGAVRTGFVVAIVVVSVLAVGWGAVGAASAQATQIDSCQTIDSPGEYVVSSDITQTSASGPCIEITADDVTLRGDGHTITGPSAPVGQPDSTEGIFAVTAEGVSGVTVTNLQTTGWESGIHFSEVTGSTVEDVTVREAGMNGIQLTNSNENQLRGITMIENNEKDLPDRPGAGRAISLSGSDQNTIEDVTLRNNKYSILLHGASEGNTVRNVTAEGSTYVIYLFGAKNNDISDVKSQNTMLYPLYSEKGAEGNTIRNLQMESATVSLTAGNLAVRPVPSPAVQQVPPDPQEGSTVDHYAEVYTTTMPFDAKISFQYDDGTVPDESRLTAWRHDGSSWSSVASATQVNTQDNVVTVDLAAIVGDEPGKFKSLGVFAPAVGDAAGTGNTTETMTPGTNGTAADDGDGTTAGDGDGTETGTDGFGPGFGALTALVAVLAAALLAARRYA